MCSVSIQLSSYDKTISHALFCFVMILLQTLKEVFNNSTFYVFYCFVMILVVIQKWIFKRIVCMICIVCDDVSDDSKRHL